MVLRVLRVSTTEPRRREYRAPEVEEEESKEASRQADGSGGGGGGRGVSAVVGGGTMASDIYSFGVLLFWMNFPER